jgi:mono/diheme cytochrome c family protein
MITRTFALALALFTPCLPACGGEERAPGQFPMSKDELGAAAPHAGEATYRRYCIGCHGVDGRGNGGITGADFTSATSPLKTRSDAELALSIREGKRGATSTMPAHGPVLNDKQIDAVIAYVRQRFDAPPPAATGSAPQQP